MYWNISGGLHKQGNSAGTLENVHYGMCAQQRLESACALAKSDQSRRCLHEEFLHPWLSSECTQRRC